MNIKIYSTSWCADCMRAKAFLKSHNIAYEDFDIEQHPDLIPLVENLNNGKQVVPTIIITKDNGEQIILSEPSNKELGSALEI